MGEELNFKLCDLLIGIFAVILVEFADEELWVPNAWQEILTHEF